MKLQLTASSLRVRIDESELAGLQAGRPLRMDASHDGSPLIALTVDVGDSFSFACIAGAWRLRIPADALQHYVATLPSRDPLTLREEGQGGVRVDFEVDVRDSIASRGPRRRAAR